MDVEKQETEFGEQYMKIKAANVKSREAFEIIQKMGYSKTKSTMNRHVAAVRRTGHALSLAKKDHSHSKLNAEQMAGVDAWILGQNTKNSPIGLCDVQKYIHDTFNIEVCLATACNILQRLGHSQKTCQSKTSGYDDTNDEKKTVYMQFITKMKNENKIHRNSSEIHSIDATYTKKPPIAITTFSRVGGGKQRADSQTHLHTNCIVTMISGDGINHTPCMLFTYDPKMAKTQKNTIRGKRVRAEFEEALERYNITEDRIVYVKSDKYYFGERPEVYEQFLTHYAVPKTDLILHDGGNAFKRQNTSIFDNLGYKNHEEYPSSVHQYLSPNDNNLHGCKSTWHQEYYKFENEVSASLRLMQLIDLDVAKNSQRYFDRNLFHVTKSDLNEIIGV